MLLTLVFLFLFVPSFGNVVVGVLFPLSLPPVGLGDCLIICPSFTYELGTLVVPQFLGVFTRGGSGVVGL